MIVKILKRNFGGAEFAPERGVLHLGGKGSAKVETLYFRLPEEWAGKAVTLHVQHQDGTLPSPLLLDEENSVVVDKTLTASAEGLWMLQAVDSGGYCALTRPSKYDCYETFSTEGEEEITPSMYEAFVAQVAESARQAKAAAKQAAESAEGIQDGASRAESAAARAEEKADGVETFAEKARASAEAAKKSEEAAAKSQTAAAGSASTAGTKASEAATSASNAASSASAAKSSQTAAATSAGQAQESAEQIRNVLERAEGFASAAQSSQQAAALSEQNAKTSETEAAGYAKTAEAAANKATAANSTDKTLSIADVPADSKAVGDALSGKLASGSADYIKSVSVSGNRMTITYGDGSTKSVTLAESYTLPAATSSTLGGVKTGENITNSSGTISLTKANVTNALGYTPPTTNTTYSPATESSAGLMSAADKTKLDGLTGLNECMYLVYNFMYEPYHLYYCGSYVGTGTNGTADSPTSTFIRTDGSGIHTKPPFAVYFLKYTTATLTDNVKRNLFSGVVNGNADNGMFANSVRTYNLTDSYQAAEDGQVYFAGVKRTNGMWRIRKSESGGKVTGWYLDRYPTLTTSTGLDPMCNYSNTTYYVFAAYASPWQGVFGD